MLIDWLTVVLLIGIGLVLIVVELIFVPGITIVGVLGVILVGVGVWISYAALGTETGHLVLAGSIIAGGLTLFYSFRSDAWSRFALKDSNKSRVNEENPHLLEVGEEGITVSALRPQGTAIFKERRHEVQSTGTFLPPNTPVRIIKIVANKITVEAIT
ncbi:NfeD family protein [Pontibacter sp. HSC-36F09]|uniref:NfeD family protein n=1 Tax=Pontibacter sp. HSC-36F09 TaxID=2910966 RepID=UPI00209EB80C|nr:NfeD family protein [Pontibacter sp. HSC-36F09]MCP2042828.1 membrane-bound ClpP family serine protease [Pontibacter sp. HSC-36F09]